MTDEQKDRAIEDSQKAVAHLLQRMNASDALRREIGFGTQSYELLTSAAASLFIEPIEHVLKHFKG
jgi:hypothetical protein